MSKKYTPEQIVRDFLPDYEERFQSFRVKDIIKNSRLFRQKFVDCYFSEAVHEMLKQQRIKCTENCAFQMGMPIVDRHSILNATEPQPINK